MFEAFFLVAKVDGFFLDELRFEHLTLVVVPITFGKCAIVQSRKYGTARLVRMRTIIEPARSPF